MVFYYLYIKKLDVIFFTFQSDEEGGKEREGEDGQQKFIAHVPVPTQQEVRHNSTQLQMHTGFCKTHLNLHQVISKSALNLLFL